VRVSRTTKRGITGIGVVAPLVGATGNSPGGAAVKHCHQHRYAEEFNPAPGTLLIARRMRAFKRGSVFHMMSITGVFGVRSVFQRKAFHRA